MTNKPLILNAGAEEYNTDYQSGNGATPAARAIESPAEENIHVLSRRAYGYDTPATRDMLRKANSSLTGTVRVPLA